MESPERVNPYFGGRGAWHRRGALPHTTSRVRRALGSNLNASTKGSDMCNCGHRLVKATVAQSLNVFDTRLMVPNIDKSDASITCIIIM